MRNPSKYDVLFPEKNILSSLRELSEGKLGSSPFIYRALVVEIDHAGGKLEKIPRQNPKNSIRGRVVSEPSPHAFLDNEDLPVFWPLFPFDVFPVKEGEHVYVVFDGEKGDHGLWISRIPEPFEVDDKNITPGINKYRLNSQEISEQQVQDLSTAPSSLRVSAEFQQEKVPKFTARVGDRVIEGSNNTLIVLGRDRVSDVKSGQKENAGAVHIVVGRQKEEDLDIENDLSTILIGMSTDIDANFKTDSVDPAVTKTAAVGIRSDEIRIVARKGIKIVVEGGDITIEGSNINIGNNATEPAVLGTQLDTYLKSVVVTTPAGPGALTPPPPGILSQTVKIKS